MHVTQRGVNRCAIFIDDNDRRHFKRLLREACCKYGISVHAFVLMDNHVHLLLSSQRQGAVSLAMRTAGQAYVQAFNIRHGRCGTLWQGRFKSSLVDSERYLLTVIRYIELNPVRAAMVATPEEFPWSSVHTHLGNTCDPLLSPHPVYLALGADITTRASAHRQWLAAGTSEQDLSNIRRHLAQERVLGDERFQQMVAKTLNRPTRVRTRGRQSRETG